MRYVALLRGVNVGGNNRVDMKELKAAFERAGMEDVQTYINSGNVIFSSGIEDRAEATALLERVIVARFGFPVDVILRNLDAMRATVRALPAEWTNDDAMRCDVLFLWDDVDTPSVVDQLRLDEEIEDVRYVPGAVIRRVDRKDAPRSGLVKIVGTPLYRQMTIRNCNTTRRLLERMEG